MMESCLRARRSDTNSVLHDVCREHEDRAKDRPLFLRALPVGRWDDPGTLTALYRTMLEELLREVGE